MDINELINSVSDNFYHRERLLKWLPILLKCTIASMLATIATALIGSNLIITLISLFVSVVHLTVLFILAAVHGRFRTAAIFSAVSAGGTLLALYVNNGLITLAISICSILASYQELNAFSEITAPLDAKLSRKWHSLFYWELAVGLLSGVFTSAAVVIAVLADLDPETIVKFALYFITAVTAALSFIRILYLKQTTALYQEG